MITETVEDNIFKNFKEYVEDKLKLSGDESIDIITSHHFTEAMCLLYKEITESPLYKEMYGHVVKKESFIKDNRYGFCEMRKEIYNPISENSHDVYFNMKHLYSYSEYYEADEGHFIENVGEFRSYEPSLERLSSEAKAIYETLKESNEKNPYLRTILHTKNIEELYQNASYSFHDSLENPFIHFHQHAKSCGLDYLDTESGGWHSQDQKHKAISLNTPIGPIAYIHFKSNLKSDGSVVDDNTFHISSIGVIPPLRQKGIAKELYLLADENLGFNEETIIHRTSPSNKAPKEFTKKVYDITKDHKALYLDHSLTKYDFSFIEGFDDLSRKNQVNCLKELNDEYYKVINSKNNDKQNNESYILSELTYNDERKLLDNFKDKIKKESEFKQSKNKKTQNPSI